MKRQSILIGAMAVLVMGGVAAVGVWNWVLGPAQEASGPITAVPLTLPAEDTIAQATTESAEGAPSGLKVLQISQGDSEVRFTLDEVLRGQPATVVGSSNQVAGEIAVDPNDLGASRVGVIQINARTLVTDQDRRNQAIRNRILETDRYELITFTPTEIRGLSGRAAVGDSFTFQIAGDLTIRDVTRPVVFDVRANVDSMDRVSGTAETTIQRSDFALVIPDVPFVADVSEAVRLEMDFVAET